MKASSISLATFVTVLLAVLAISPPIPDAWAAVTASAPASRPASAPATQAANLPVGTLMPVAEIVKNGVRPSHLDTEGVTYFNSMSWASAPADSGLVNPRAVVCKLAGTIRVNCSAALDSLNPDDQAVNVVRLDVSGKGQFQNALVLPLRQDYNSTSYKIAPVAVNLELDSRTIPAMVWGFYSWSLPASQPSADGGEQAVAKIPRQALTLIVGTAMSGTCRFGEKVYAVKLADVNGDLILGQPVPLLGCIDGHLQMPPGPGGDSLVVLSKDNGSLVSKAMLGHPVLVDGVWYDVKVGPGGATMEAAARSEPTGTVAVDADKWTAMLIQGQTAYCISGGRQGMSVPAGQYDIVAYEQTGSDKAGYSLLVLMASNPETQRIKVEAGQGLALRIGPPLKGILNCAISPAAQGQRLLNTSMAYRDVGDRVAYLQFSGEPPKITIKDETGKELTSGPVSYGWGGTITHSWRVPDGVKGTLAVELETEKLPVKVVCPPVKVEVK